MTARHCANPISAAGGYWRSAYARSVKRAIAGIGNRNRKFAFALSGAFTADWRHIDMPEQFLITCTGGAEGKCVRFGYKPWRQSPDGGSLLAYYHSVCDWCGPIRGDGIGHTRNGTPIDLFDRIGIQPDEAALADYADRVIARVEAVAPGFTGSVLHRQVIGPHEMQEEYGLVGGNIFHGELSLEQLFHMRPAPGFADYRTPVAGLYYGSSATHAGGGVCGIPGWQAAKAAIADRKSTARSGRARKVSRRP